MSGAGDASHETLLRKGRARTVLLLEHILASALVSMRYCIAEAQSGIVNAVGVCERLNRHSKPRVPRVGVRGFALSLK